MPSTNLFPVWLLAYGRDSLPNFESLFPQKGIDDDPVRKNRDCELRTFKWLGKFYFLGMARLLFNS